MATRIQFLAFTLDGRHYGLPLARVERVIHAVEPTPLPDSPENVMGIINLRGKIVPIFNLRKRFGFADRELAVDDCFVIASTAKQTVALAVDSSDGVIELDPEQIVATEKIIDQPQQIRGVIRLKDELLLIQDLDQFLTAEQEVDLEDALARR